jgi:hypothetical protein
MISTPSDISSKMLDDLREVSDFRNFTGVLLNLFETQSQQLLALELENQVLRDEIARLKGGNPKPQIRAQTPSAPVARRPEAKNKNHKFTTPNSAPTVVPDKVISIELDKTNLPSDILSKGYEDFTQYDLLITREITLYRRERYYSPSTGNNYVAAWPSDFIPRKYGPQLRTFINVLHHFGDMTQGRMEAVLKSINLPVSGGSISNILKEESDWSIKEQGDILRAALQTDAVAQMDTTGNRQKGKNRVTHLITGRYFTSFYTLSTKSRLDCFLALQGNPSGGLIFQWDESVQQSLLLVAVGLKTVQAIGEALVQKATYTLEELNEVLTSKCAKIFGQKTTMKRLMEAMAYGYYVQQTEYPALQILLSDDAPEYQAIAANHALCWIHDARNYRKLNPILPVYEEVLDNFMKKYWEFYQKLLDFKDKANLLRSQHKDIAQIEKAKTQEKLQKEALFAEFDFLFQQNEAYDLLNKEIGRTKANKTKLLMVLDYPNLPLHNNAAELAARRVVRKRDISLHTCSEWGTQVRDAMMSIIETAIKVGISAWEYIHDRIAKKYKMDPIAQTVANKMEFSRVF